MKPKKSAGCHQTLSAQVGSGDETNFILVTISSDEELNLTPSDQSNCKSIELQAKLVSSQLIAKSATEF